MIVFSYCKPPSSSCLTSIVHTHRQIQLTRKFFHHHSSSSLKLCASTQYRRLGGYSSKPLFELYHHFRTFRAANMSTSPSNSSPLLTLDNINQNVKTMEYAVRGPLVIRAGELEKELAAGGSKPFKEIIRANIGDCHAMGQKPLTFFRQVIACCVDTSLLDDDRYPRDVRERVKLILSYCGGKSVGAYSDSAGVEIIRRHCAEFIAARDGIPSDWADIVLTTGASESVRAVLTLINGRSTDSQPSGVMIPIPQYPLYTATIAEYSMHPIKYYLGMFLFKLFIIMPRTKILQL